MDTVSKPMNEDGDKMMTIGEEAPNRTTQKRGKAGPIATASIESTSTRTMCVSDSKALLQLAGLLRELGGIAASK
ncbi:MAG: hypothetical protein WCL19_08980, partial [Verrucomicrobiota bacterium]